MGGARPAPYHRPPRAYKRKQNGQTIRDLLLDIQQTMPNGNSEMLSKQ